MNKNIQWVMLHHTAISYDKNPDQFEATNNYHRDKKYPKSSLGFYVGYNYEIAKNGRVRQARKEGEATAACYQKDMNDGRAIHISLDGNFDTEDPQPAQIFALRDLMKQIVADYNIKKENIVFHRDYATKTCPGNKIKIDFIRSLAFPENDDTGDKVKAIIKSLENAIELLKKL